MIGRWLTSERGLAVLLSTFSVLIAAFAVALVLLFNQSSNAAHDAKRAVSDIQESRLELCRQQNQRHDRTVRALDAQIAKLPTGQRRLARTRRAGTITLIDALAPRLNCGRLVK